MTNPIHFSSQKLKPSFCGGFFFIIYLLQHMPGPTINIFDIPLEAFEQYQSGRRFSANITLPFRPHLNSNVVLHCEHQQPPAHTPHPIHTTLKHFIDLDTILASHNYYALTFDL